MSLTRQVVLLLLLIGSGLSTPAQSTIPAEEATLSQEELIEAGKQIYLHGSLPGGASITAMVRKDVALQGSQYACANCHRRSGIGSSEGGDLVPPVIGPSIFAPRVAELHAQYPLGGMHNETRPAYTTETLGRALREGIDPAGRLLSPLMPRFVLNDNEVVALSSYLASLTVALPPGINAREIHFATIATPGDDAARAAMLDVFTTFFRVKNAGTRSELKRAQYAPFQKQWAYESYRLWKLHVWDLKGPEQNWPDQLKAFYAKQPVFAVIGGVGNGNWLPVHRFCEKQELPCILPQIALPPEHADNDFYSVYFSHGVELEAMTLGNILSATYQAPRTVVQVLRDTPEAHAAADTLRHAMAAQGNITLKDVVLKEGQTTSVEFWSRLAADYNHSPWVLWLGDGDLKSLDSSAAAQPSAIYLSATLQGDITTLQQHPLHQRFTLLSPYQPPGSEHNTPRFSSWAHLRKLPVSNLHIQSSSFLAVTLAGESLKHMHGNFSREYFIERMEHMMDNMINPSLYPRLSLAPGQRFASKGCYVWEMDKRFETAKWVVP